MTLPKHIQEAATPLTDAHSERWNEFDASDEHCPRPEQDIDFARNLERLTIWQQEVTEKQHKAIQSAMDELSAFGPADEDTEYEDAVIAFNQLQTYLKTLKGEK